MFSTVHGLFCNHARVLEFLYCVNLGVEWPNHRVCTWLVLLGDDNCLPEWLCQDILRGCMKLTGLTALGVIIFFKFCLFDGYEIIYYVFLKSRCDLCVV